MPKAKALALPLVDGARVRSRAWRPALGLAAASGLRTMLGPAFAIRRRSRSGALQKLATILACAELVADKLPGIPRRTAALPLIGRALSGAAVATALRPRPGRAWVAAFLGATVAVTAALAGLRARSALDRALGGRAIHNAVGGAIEDLAVLAIGTALARRA